MRTVQIPFASDLWPDGLYGSHGARSYLPLVRGGIVRTLISADHPAVVAAALSQGSGPETTTKAVLRRALAASGRLASQTGLLRLSGRLLSTERAALERQLGRYAGVDEPYLSISFGPARANQKPVARIFDADGRMHAVAKIGSTDLTSALLLTEAQALRWLADARPPGLLIPRLLAHERWRGLSVLVQSVVDTGGRQATPSQGQLTAAETTVCCSGPMADLPVDRGDYQQDLRRRVAGLEDNYGAILAKSLEAILSELGTTSVITGSWHGDWSPQNFCLSAQGVGVWDWERWSHGRPAGFDALHLRTYQLFAEEPTLTTVGRRLLAEAPNVLGPHQPTLDARSTALVAGLYLIEIGWRYEHDGQRLKASTAGRYPEWLLPALAHLTSTSNQTNIRGKE